MLSQPLVTILVPSYNHARYLGERIGSIMAQSYRPFELIVIDDCSKDDSDDVLRALQEKHNFAYIRNVQNSGTPFSAWERICSLAKGEFIWICESDDVAEPTFLETAVQRLQANPAAVLFYSNSLVIDEDGRTVGHTESYFKEVWQDERWLTNFSADGLEELVRFQLRGQTVPNMSSALFAANAFRNAFDPFVKRLRLTGDWLFVGEVLRYGDVEFCHKPLSRFRKHAETSRVRVQSARSQAEFILTKYKMFRRSGQGMDVFASVMSSDVVRFLYEPASWWDVLSAAIRISFIDTWKCAVFLAVSALRNPLYWEKFKERYKHSKMWSKVNE